MCDGKVSCTEEIEYKNSRESDSTWPEYSRPVSWQCAYIHCHLVLANCPVSAGILALTSIAAAQVGTVQGSQGVSKCGTPCSLSQANALFTQDLQKAFIHHCPSIS